MENEPINLTHQKLLEERFRKMKMEISEYTFANVYLFREIHQYELVFNRDIYIKGVTRDKLTYLMPTTPIKEINIGDLIDSLRGCDFIFPIQEDWRTYFPETQFEIHYLDDESDYLYDVNKMSTFSGRKLSGRRNLLKQFQELFPSHRTVPLTGNNSTDALAVLTEWQNITHQEEGLTDYKECHEAIILMDKLGLSGQLTYINEKPAAFILGEELNSNTFVIHFAKGFTQFKGIYQYLYHTFANFLAKKYLMINLEQDMGAVELRHAKRAYQPDRLLPKLRIKLGKQKA
jgi:uncharacterized protein